MAVANFPTTVRSGPVNPLQNPETYDKIMIGGQTSPGIGKLTKAVRKSGWDIKHGKGAQGSTLTYVGLEPVEFTFTIQLWRVQDWNDWDKFLPLLKYDGTKTSVAAIEIYHPALARLDIHSVVCHSIGQETQVSCGLFSIDLEFIEYRKPPKANATSTADGSKGMTKLPNQPDGTPNPIPDTNQAIRDEAAALTITATSPTGSHP